jgi:hypothetical protein
VVAFDSFIDVQSVPGEGPVLLSIAHNDVENNFEEVDSVDLIIG